MPDSDKAVIQKDTYTPVFIAALFTISRTGKQPTCSSAKEWIKEVWYIYTMGCYSAIKKNKIILFSAALMDLEIVIRTEVKSDTER